MPSRVRRGAVLVICSIVLTSFMVSLSNNWSLKIWLMSSCVLAVSSWASELCLGSSCRIVGSCVGFKCFVSWEPGGSVRHCGQTCASCMVYVEDRSEYRVLRQLHNRLWRVPCILLAYPYPRMCDAATVQCRYRPKLSKVSSGVKALSTMLVICAMWSSVDSSSYLVGYHASSGVDIQSIGRRWLEIVEQTTLMITYITWDVVRVIGSHEECFELWEWPCMIDLGHTCCRQRRRFIPQLDRHNRNWVF